MGDPLKDIQRKPGKDYRVIHLTMNRDSQVKMFWEIHLKIYRESQVKIIG